MAGNPIFELIVVLTAVFGLIAGIIRIDLPFVRDVIAIYYMFYGSICFPYKIVDRYARPGLGSGCVVIFLSGVISFFTGSWWFLPGAILGFLITGIINLRYDNPC